MRVAIAVVVAVAHGVQHAQALERGVEGASTANLVDVARAVERQRGEQRGVDVGVQLHEAGVLGVGQDAQVRAADGLHAALLPFAQEPFQVGMHLGRAARDVDRLEPALLVGVEARLHGLAAHHLLARGAASQMAVAARQVAFVAHVHLQRGQRVVRAPMFFGHHLDKRRHGFHGLGNGFLRHVSLSLFCLRIRGL